MRATGLQSHIWNNNLKSMALLCFYPILLLAMGWAGAFTVGSFVVPNSISSDGAAFQINMANHFIGQYWPAFVTVCAVWFAIAYFFHTKMVRKMAHSHSVTRKDEPALYNLTENLCIAAGIKMPKLEIIETHARNAFASGIDEKSFTVTVTRGLLQSLSKDEVEAVIAHELTHIQNRDVRLLIITIIFTGMIGFMAQMAWSTLRYSIFIPSRHNNRGNGGTFLLIIGLMVILGIGYFASMLTRFALSRRREYMADAGAVQMTKNPDAMMRALMRIAGSAQIPKMPADVNMMCIENKAAFLGMFATHPPIEKRIRALSLTNNAPLPDLPQLTPFHAPRTARDDAFQSPWVGRDNWVTATRLKHRRNQRNNP